MGSEALRVLMVDDNEGDYVLTKSALERTQYCRFDLDWAPSLAAGFQALNLGGHDAYLVNLGLGDGLELLRRAARLRPEVACVAISGTNARDPEAQAVGADDCVTKDELSTRGLERSLRYAIESRRRAASERARAEDIGILVQATRTAIAGEALESVLQHCVAQICSRGAWAVGHVFLRREALVPSQIWYVDDTTRRRPFTRATESARFAPGQGLSGRTLEADVIQWIPDLAATEWYVRRPAALAADLRCAAAVTIRGRSDCLGVLELYAEAREAPPASERALLEQLGSTIGLVHEMRQMEVAQRVEDASRADERRAEVLALFAASVAHDLKNAIMSVGGLIAVARATLADGSRPAQDLDLANRQLTIVNEISDRLQSLGRASDTTLEPECDPSVVTDSVLKVAKRTFPQGIEWQIAAPANCPTVPLSSVELHQLLENLLTNASRALDGRGTIGVSIFPGPDAVVLEVKDDGPGVDPGIVGNLFEPHVSTRKYGNGGLGLASVRESVTRCGGEVELVPTRHGACFRVTLPRCDESS